MAEVRRVPMAEADPYLLFGLLGKQVIHAGGRKATEELLGLAALAPGQQVLDIGVAWGPRPSRWQSVSWWQSRLPMSRPTCWIGPSRIEPGASRSRNLSGVVHQYYFHGI